jgi:Zn-dependent metalloprotease
MGMYFHKKGTLSYRRHSNICFILPEYVNKRIVEKGSEEQKRRAWQNLILTEQLRGRRNIVGGLSTMFPSSNRLYRSIFDARNGQILPGDLVMAEGGAKKGGTEVDEAYDYSGDTYEFFSKVFVRKSIDNKGMRLDSTVHYGDDYKR